MSKNAILTIELQEMQILQQVFRFPKITVHEGDLIGLLGQSGSGKSILLRQMAGLMGAKSNCTFHGQRKAFVFGRAGLFQHYTVRENLQLCTMFTTLSVKDPEITACLEKWGLSSVQDRVAGQLSPQAIKITQIARAEIMQPNILFVEKPLYGLSMQQADLFMEWIEAYTQNGGALVYSEESARVFQKLNPTRIHLGGGDDNLRTVFHH